MSVKKRGSVYYTDFTSPQGKRIRISTGTEDKRQAQEYETKLKSDLWRQGKLGEKPSYYFSDAIIKYLEFKEGEKTKKELNNDRIRLRYWIDSIGDIPLDQITGVTLDDAINKKPGITSATKNRYLAVMRHLLRLTKRWGWIDSYPDVFMKTESPPRERVVSQEERYRLYNELPEHLKEPFILALLTGQRSANIIRLTRSQVLLDIPCIVIEARRMKGRKPHAVPLCDDAVKLLKNVLSRHKNEYVFLYEGKPIKEIRSRTWKKAKLRAGIEDLRWHDLRHTCATDLAEADTPLEVIQRVLAHSDRKMTQRYEHRSLAAIKKHVDKLKFDTNLPQEENNSISISGKINYNQDVGPLAQLVELLTLNPRYLYLFCLLSIAYKHYCLNTTLISPSKTVHKQNLCHKSVTEGAI